MRLQKIIFASFLAASTLFSTCVGAADYDISSFGINNISIPASFSSCTREECDSGFEKLLLANGYTHSEWKEDIMIPGNLYVCARDAGGNAINVIISDPSSERDKEDNIKFHRLMYDYNLYESSPKTKEAVLVKYRDTLAESGINKRKIMRIKWYEKDELSSWTPYVLGIYENNDGAFVSDFFTIYNGNALSISLISKREPTRKELSFMSEIIKGIDFGKEIDYSHAKQVYRQNQRVKLPERLNIKQKRSKTLVGAALVFITVVITTAIAITITKLRKRTKSSRNSKNGRY